MLSFCPLFTNIGTKLECLLDWAVKATRNKPSTFPLTFINYSRKFFITFVPGFILYKFSYYARVSVILDCKTVKL